MSLRQVSIVFFAACVSAQQVLYGQCGGIGWSGQTSCVAGSYCAYTNAYYSQCIPGTAATTSSTSSTVVVVNPTTSTSVPTTAQTPTTTVGGNAASTCATIDPNLKLTSNTALPDPFTALSGSRLTTKSQFTCRQSEFSQLLQKYEMGTFPPKPSSVTASLSGSTLTINANNGGTSISFSVTITKPSTGTAPYPAIIAFGGASIPFPAGIATITFNNDDIAAQTDGSSRGKGKFYTLYGASHSAGALTAWAWGVDRIMDALELVPATNINPLRVGVTGCSRNGKGALTAGAFVNRIRLTIPQESGSGGDDCWRISDWQKAQGLNTQTASQIVTENVWFSTNFNPYVNTIPLLPFDHHMLAGMIAPRPIFGIENRFDWLGDLTMYGCMAAAREIWTALGATAEFGFSQQGNHNHCSFPSAQQAHLFAYINKYLLDQTAATGIFETDVTYSNWNRAQWIPWTTPTLT